MSTTVVVGFDDRVCMDKKTMGSCYWEEVKAKKRKGIVSFEVIHSKDRDGFDDTYSYDLDLGIS